MGVKENKNIRIMKMNKLKNLILRELSINGRGVKRKKIEADLTLKEKKQQLKMAIEYTNNVPEPKLQIGCGGNRLNGWLNTDIISKNPKVFLMDVVKKFPFENNTFNFIFSEHTLEHLSFEDSCNMLTECYRVLKPNGVIRIGVPHIDFLVKLYQNPEKPLHKKFIKSHLEYAYKDIVDFYGNEQIISPEVFVVNSYYRNFGHQVIHNYGTLKQLLEKSNFSNVQQKEVGVSAYVEISQIRRRGKKYNEEFNKLETLDVEAVKK